MFRIANSRVRRVRRGKCRLPLINRYTHPGNTAFVPQRGYRVHAHRLRRQQPDDGSLDVIASAECRDRHWYDHRHGQRCNGRILYADGGGPAAAPHDQCPGLRDAAGAHRPHVAHGGSDWRERAVLARLLSRAGAQRGRVTGCVAAVAHADGLAVDLFSTHGCV